MRKNYAIIEASLMRKLYVSEFLEDYHIVDEDIAVIFRPVNQINGLKI